MNEITEALYARHVRDLEATIASLQAQVVALVHVAGKGKRVTISKGQQREADKAIDAIDVKRMSSGELRFTPIAPDA